MTNQVHNHLLTKIHLPMQIPIQMKILPMETKCKITITITIKLNNDGAKAMPNQIQYCRLQLFLIAFVTIVCTN